MEITKEQMTERFQQLPDIIKEVLGSDETVDTLLKFSKKYGLHLDQTNRLNKIMGQVLHGFIKTRDFNSVIKKELGISEDLANLLTYDINQQIFSRIRQELEDLTQRKEAIDYEQSFQSKNQSATQIFTEKMTSVTNVPKQEVAVTPQTSDNKVRDPYREPIV